MIKYNVSSNIWVVINHKIAVVWIIFIAPKSEFADQAQEIHIKIIYSLIDTIEKMMHIA